jgi:hypothetical protein
MTQQSMYRVCDLKRNLNNNHVPRYMIEIGSCSSLALDSFNFPVSVTLAARLQLLVVTQSSVDASRVCLFWNITSHRNRLLLLVKHLTMHTLTGKRRTGYL